MSSLSFRAEALVLGHIGHLRVGATPQTMAALIAPTLKLFRNAFPRIDVTLIEGTNNELLEFTRQRTAHLVVASPEDPGAFNHAPLFDAKLLAYVPKDFSLGEGTGLPIGQLADAPILVLRRGFITRDLFDHACKQGADQAADRAGKR